jgi:hypothetical protein
MMNLKKHIYRISVATFIVSLLLSANCFAQDIIGKEIKESFAVNNNSQLNIINKYGSIDIKNWEKNTISVLVQIKHTDLSESKAKELLEMISINYHTEGDKIFFETKFDDSFGKTLNRLNNGGKKFEINYSVNMPHSVPVDLNNKYGSIFIDKISAPSRIAVKYGNLKANDISSASKSPMTEIIMGYSEGNIEISSWLKLSVKYSKISIEESKALVVLSKYSKVYVDRGSSIVTESKYDTYEIGSIANFVSEAEYSNYKFNSVGKKLHIETKYTDVKVGYIPAAFEEIKIINRYGSYNLGIEEGASYQIKGLAKYGNIVYPENSQVNRFQESNELRIEGFVGNNSETKTKVTIDTKYGTIKLKR